MSLVDRASAFFMVALGTALVGSSATMYGLIRDHLYHKFDREILTALNVLVAAVEVETDGVKWQPSDHTITLGDEDEDDAIRWLMTDETGHVIDASTNLRTNDPGSEQLFETARAENLPHDQFAVIDGWRLMQHRLRAPFPKPTAVRDLDEYAEARVTVARSPQNLHAELFQLTLLSIGLPSTFWLLAAIMGRAICRRALRPVGAMAEAARSTTTADFTQRLPVPDHHDELTDLAISFNELLDRLHTAYSQQQRFTGDAAHQLRTPLTVLRGQIDVALRRPRSEREYRHTLTELERHTCGLEQVVESLLFLARAESGGVSPELEPVNLGEWVPRVLETWQGHPRAADLLVVAERVPVVRTSPPLLRQAVDNLLGNAMKYSEPGSPISVTVSASPLAVEIAIADEGSGIDPSELDTVFEPFYRTDAARRSGVTGTGLGLAIVRHIADVLRCQVRCESGPGQGSRFLLEVPMAPRPDHERPGT